MSKDTSYISIIGSGATIEFPNFRTIELQVLCVCPNPHQENKLEFILDWEGHRVWVTAYKGKRDWNISNIRLQNWGIRNQSATRPKTNYKATLKDKKLFSSITILSWEQKYCDYEQFRKYLHENPLRKKV